MSSGISVPNVRISARAHKILRRLAKDANESMQSVLDKAIESYRRQEFLRAANRDYQNLRRKSTAWKETLAERAHWETAIRDGLDRR